MELFGLGADPEFCGYEVQGEEEMTSAGCRHQRGVDISGTSLRSSTQWKGVAVGVLCASMDLSISLQAQNG